MFSCPEGTVQEGRACCEAIRQALSLINREPSESSCQEYVRPLEQLLDLHEASLADAVDFHMLRHLDDHYMSCCRASSILQFLSEKLTLADPVRDQRVKQLLRGASLAAQRGGTWCRSFSTWDYPDLDYPVSPGINNGSDSSP